MRREWWGPLTAIAFIVVVIVGLIIGGEPPAADPPVQEIIDHYTANKTSTVAASFVGAAAAVLLMFFGAGLMLERLRTEVHYAPVARDGAARAASAIAALLSERKGNSYLEVHPHNEQEVSHALHHS